MTITQSFLGDISSVITKGTTPTSVGFEFAESGVPFLRVQNLAGGAVDLTKTPLFISTATHKALSRSTIYPGDVLISIAGTIGRAAVVSSEDPAEMNSNQAVGIIRLKNGVNRRYILHWLQSNEAQSQIRGAQVTGTITNLSLTELRKLQIPLPPLAEQKRIAAILDAADALRTKRRESLAQLDALLQSTFLTLFGNPVDNLKQWKSCSVGEVTDCIVPGRDKPKSFSGGIPWITTDALQHLETTFISSKGMGLNAAEIAEVRARVIPEGSVIISCVGDLGIVSIAGKDLVINQQLHSFQCHETMNNIFLMHCLVFQKAFMYAKASSTTLPYMNKTVCNSIPVITPPLPLQQKFAAIVESVERQKAAQRAHLAELDALFAALQHRAFRGEL
jgi:type I restriction enzyme S subunit